MRAHSLKRRFLFYTAAAALFFTLVPLAAYAESQDNFGSVHCHTDTGEAGVWVSIAVNGKHCLANKQGNIPTNQSIIFIYLTSIIKFLTAGAGVLAIGGVVWGGIMYSTARGNSAQVQKAVTIILNSVVGLILFFLLAALFNYIIPGGVFT